MIDSLISDHIIIINRVQQGGVLFPQLFAIYINKLSAWLNQSNVTCCF